MNKALTGTITVDTVASSIDGGTAQTIATITNPAVGDNYIYRGLRAQGKVRVNPSGTTDITVTKLGPGSST